MSHGHSHAPGEDHGHSHGGEDHGHSHGPGEDHGHAHGPQQPQQQQIAPDPDPLQQAVIDASFTPIDLLISPDTDEGAHGAVLLCRPHQRETCADCGLDFGSQNRIARVLVANPNLLCPPPAKVVNPQVTQFVTQTKEEGNVSALCYTITITASHAHV
jgi:translocation protein SEC72